MRKQRLSGSRLLFTALLSAAVTTCPLGKAIARQPAMADRHAPACIERVAGGRAWLERTLWGLRDQEGGWVGAKVRNRDGSYDLGLLQINSWWVPKLASATGKTRTEIEFWLQNDACFNVDAARWIFLTGLSLTRDYWKAVGAYHSPNDIRQRLYATRVAGKLMRRFGARIFAAPDSRRLPPGDHRERAGIDPWSKQRVAKRGMQY